MAILNGQKPTLLSQVKNQNVQDISKLKQLLDFYTDLKVEDFKDCVSDFVYSQLESMVTDEHRNPHEKEEWEAINAMPKETSSQITDCLNRVETYITSYSDSPKINEAKALKQNLSDKIYSIQEQEEAKRIMEEQARKAEQEKKEWSMLDKGNYNSLKTYRLKFPYSVHLSELDDIMWINAKNSGVETSLKRYLTDWPEGKHAVEAQNSINESAEWKEIKHYKGDLEERMFVLDDYRDSHPDSFYKNEIDSLYNDLRIEILDKMKKNPSEFDRDTVQRYIDSNIFSQWDLMDEELMTDESWERLRETDRDSLPDMKEFQEGAENVTAPEGCTDIYLFGTPGTGKTCLLMGLTGANGNGYSLNMKTHGGTYAAALYQYVLEGITPGGTYGSYVSVINGYINDVKKNKEVRHNVNFVEMSGEEFALRIADGREVTLEDMGTGATNLLSNNNRKVFFIIIDPTRIKVKVNYIQDSYDADGNITDRVIRRKYVSQIDIMNKFVSLLALPENKEIMSKVDAIHFIVTKADTMGDEKERKEKARDLLLDNFQGPVTQLKGICSESKRINYSTNYSPLLFTFSLGKFYLGDIFDFDKKDTLSVIDTIRNITAGEKKESWWDKLKRTIG